jgi:hypothetical protein
MAEADGKKKDQKSDPTRNSDFEKVIKRILETPSRADRRPALYLVAVGLNRIGKVSSSH